MIKKRKMENGKWKMQPAVTVCFIFILSSFTAAHDGEPHNFSDLLKAWSFDPLVVVTLVVSASIYARGVFCLWSSSERGRGISVRATMAFAAGWLSFFVALVSPLHSWGEVLFSAHMTQHEILMLVSAPFFILGKPFVAAFWAIPRHWRGGAKNLIKAKPVERSWRFITNPFVAWTIHAVALWVWHIPLLFQATLQSDLIHTLQHASFFLSALLFWWAILSSPRGLMSYGAGVLYLFTTSIHSGLLGAFLTFTTGVWYPAYEKSTASWGLTALEDQQLGGLIMWVPAGVIYIVAGLIMFAGWLEESEKRVLMREKRMFAPESKLESKL